MGLANQGPLPVLAPPQLFLSSSYTRTLDPSRQAQVFLVLQDHEC